MVRPRKSGRRMTWGLGSTSANFSSTPGSSATRISGMGWSLNPGAVNREVRGLPDDFNGQSVNKKLTQRPNQTFGVNVALANLEIFGADSKKLGVNLNANVNIFYNNYRGFNVEPGFGFSLMDAQDRKSADGASEKNPIDTNGRVGSPPSFPFKIRMNEKREEKKSIFANPVQSFGSHYKNLWKRSKQNPGGLFSSSIVPSVSDINYTHPMSSSSYTLHVKTGIVAFGISGDLQVHTYFNELKVADKDVNIPAYGYLYSDHNLGNSKSGLMDFTMGNQSMLTPDSRILPVPNHTNDVYHVSSQGVNGTVRAFKGGVTKLIDPTVVSKKKNIGGGFELNSLLISNKVGINLNAGGGNSYTGPWENGDEPLQFLNTPLQNLRVSEPLLEPYYFKFANELTSQSNTNTAGSDKNAVRFDLDKKFGLFAAEAKLKPSLQGSSLTNSLDPSNAFKTQREKRVNSFMALTEAEAAAFDGYTRKVGIVSNPASTVDINFETSSSPDKDRIGAIHVSDGTGMRYIYGIPAKNNLQKQTTFSTGAVYGTGLANLIGKSVNNSSTENSLQNSSGTDHFYSATQTPEYAHSYLLTEILSEDFVDINSNGPDKEDFGIYTKFGYVVKQDFKTKSPVSGADYLPGDLSNEGDDKGTITYFEKDLYYLRSIETKSHIAIFEIEERDDAYGVGGENSGPTSLQSQYRLKNITLYNVDDYNENGASAKPIKTVHFGYSYELCDGATNASSGKLTLKKVWYTVGTEKTKMSLSPYEFAYTNNYDYNENHVDRWATYQTEEQNIFGSNTLYPYTTQLQSDANAFAAAWNLSEITLPTGGVITVNYEADDYQYVQNRKAQRMCEIIGFATGSLSSHDSVLSDDKDWMIVDVAESLQNAQEGLKYTAGLKQLYFKAFMKMKEFEGESNPPPQTTPFNGSDLVAYDFVEGYLDLASEDPEIYSYGGKNYLAIRVKKDGRGRHPVKKAGWVALRLNRNDLLDDSGIDIDGFSNFSASILGAIGSVISKAVEFAVDEGAFFIKANNRGWCNHLSTGLKSIVRLNVAGKKIGGGHRVKDIKISDEWSQMGGGSSDDYGQTYSYILPDGSSSGVAQYEPLTGGEENPFREPVRYGTDKLFFKDSDLYSELPIGEAFFPMASVGYSRVVVTNKANQTLTNGGAGVQVTEFYTAKDYPVQTSRTDIHKVNAGTAEKLIALIGNKKYFQPGFSQGYSIELNNMHGQKKSEATYRANANLAKASPVQKTAYYYSTEGGYLPGKVNKLKNEVNVIGPDGIESKKEIGVTQDTYVHMGESHERTYGGAVDGDLDFGTPPALYVVPSAYPNIDYSYTMTRTVTMNKVISQAGILEKVVTFYNGAETTQEHLSFDEETGVPLVSYTTNDFNDTISTATHLARWDYTDMGGSYQNEGIVIEGQVSDYLNYLVPGDMLINPTTQEKVWVTKNNGNLEVREKDGTLFSNANLRGFKLIRSGYSNKMGTTLSSVTTKGNPYQFFTSSSVDDVLQADAMTYSDELKIALDLGGVSASDTTGMALNPYAYAMKGVYKPSKSYFHLVDRSQIHEGQNSYDFHTRIQSDGIFKDFHVFDPEGGNSGWYLSNEIVLYDHNGFAIEEKDALGNYSAALYGYDRNLPIAVAQNAMYQEIAFESFEDYKSGSFSSPQYPYLEDPENTHLRIEGSLELSEKGDSHTGLYSFITGDPEIEANLDDLLEFTPGKQYLLQAWRKTSAGGALSVEVDNADPGIVAGKVSPSIEGWELVEVVFIAGTTHKLVFEGENSQYDDIKIHPLDAGFVGYVYDRYSHRVTAVLDANHFATVYSYDHDGVLVKTAKETERGYKTIQSTLRNTKQRSGTPQS